MPQQQIVLLIVRVFIEQEHAEEVAFAGGRLLHVALETQVVEVTPREDLLFVADTYWAFGFV